MKQRVYIETSVASYLTARPSRDLVVAAHQEITRDWWLNYRHNFQLYVSEITLGEAARGDKAAAARRLAELRDIEIVRLSNDARALARSFIDKRIIPVRAFDDALHVALATTQEVEFLLTWNCRHIANAEITVRLKQACTLWGYEMPILCTPEQLMGE